MPFGPAAGADWCFCSTSDGRTEALTDFPKVAGADTVPATLEARWLPSGASCGDGAAAGAVPNGAASAFFAGQLGVAGAGAAAWESFVDLGPFDEQEIQTFLSPS